MDRNGTVLDFQRSEPDGTSVRTDLVEPLLEQTKLLVLHTLEQTEEIRQRYAALRFPREHESQFMFHLLQDPTSWWVDVGGRGVVYLTQVTPSANAYVNILFWDGKFCCEKRAVTQVVLGEAFEQFQLPRITALVQPQNKPLRDQFRRMGFALEGTLRNGARVQNGYTDLIMFGLLREDLPPVPRINLHGPRR